jgi:5-methylcytosine-specific restriction endonuclease McrA
MLFPGRTEFPQIATARSGHVDRPHTQRSPSADEGVRDEYRCSNCGWVHALWNPSDPRHLELHHLHAHAQGGENTPENLSTLCSVCHDGLHAGQIALRGKGAAY